MARYSAIRNVGGNAMNMLILKLMIALPMWGFGYDFNFGGHKHYTAPTPTSYNYYDLAGADDHYTLANGDKYQVATY